ncbi:MAG TPA: hypothetical protein DCK98_02735 [Chloroflexi bacterium]|jgi:hypothetical protein|nr:hypothetical protein [Chloroflexota bacterium]HAL25119.1 hypothetical protein [Chloroflexota bacterium]
MAATETERCTECGAPLTDGVCGSCAPSGRPLDKGARRRVAAAAAHEKELWDEHAVTRKLHARADADVLPARKPRPRSDRPPAP